MEQGTSASASRARPTSRGGAQQQHRQQERDVSGSASEYESYPDDVSFSAKDKWTTVGPRRRYRSREERDEAKRGRSASAYVAPPNYQEQYRGPGYQGSRKPPPSGGAAGTSTGSGQQYSSRGRQSYTRGGGQRPSSGQSGQQSQQQQQRSHSPDVVALDAHGPGMIPIQVEYQGPIRRKDDMEHHSPLNYEPFPALQRTPQPARSPGSPRDPQPSTSRAGSQHPGNINRMLASAPVFEPRPPHLLDDSAPVDFRHNYGVPREKWVNIPSDANPDRQVLIIEPVVTKWHGSQVIDISGVPEDELLVVYHTPSKKVFESEEDWRDSIEYANYSDQVHRTLTAVNSMTYEQRAAYQIARGADPSVADPRAYREAKVAADAERRRARSSSFGRRDNFRERYRSQARDNQQYPSQQRRGYNEQGQRLSRGQQILQDYSDQAYQNRAQEEQAFGSRFSPLQNAQPPYDEYMSDSSYDDSRDQSNRRSSKPMQRGVADDWD